MSLTVQHCNSNLYLAILRWLGRECFLPWYAICDWILVPKGRARQTIMHISYQQRTWHNVLRVFDGCSVSSRWKGRIKRLAMVWTLIHMSKRTLLIDLGSSSSMELSRCRLLLPVSSSCLMFQRLPKLGIFLRKCVRTEEFER